jgi:hypothetical protein
MSPHPIPVQVLADLAEAFLCREVIYRFPAYLRLLMMNSTFLASKTWPHVWHLMTGGVVCIFNCIDVMRARMETYGHVADSMGLGGEEIVRKCGDGLRGLGKMRSFGLQ